MLCSPTYCNPLDRERSRDVIDPWGINNHVASDELNHIIYRRRLAIDAHAEVVGRGQLPAPVQQFASSRIKSHDFNAP